MTDPIADMATRIRNAQAIKAKTVVMPHSLVKEAIAKVLTDAGYITAFEKIETGKHPELTITLKYEQSEAAISKILRVSKPGRRVYVQSADLKPVLAGHGMQIISTSRGVMTDRQARAQKLGGEVLCKLW